MPTFSRSPARRPILGLPPHPSPARPVPALDSAAQRLPPIALLLPRPGPPARPTPRSRPSSRARSPPVAQRHAPPSPWPTSRAPDPETETAATISPNSLLSPRSGHPGSASSPASSPP
eukprot:XP_020400930.1 vegetative cell wall protein gp1-like [Zea mays]